MKKICLIDKEKLVNEIIQFACSTAYCNATNSESNKEYYKKCMGKDFGNILETLKYNKKGISFGFSNENLKNCNNND